ncbi:hypothetical protein ON010_g4375 [Phytophthora cinnamomi]|nr:hypothetical protein ON010_g4375 [Phytophthora cinnamomi]
MSEIVPTIHHRFDEESSSGDSHQRYRTLGRTGFVTLLLVAAYTTSPMDRSSNLRSAVFTPMQTDDTAGGWTPDTGSSGIKSTTLNSTSESRLRTLDIGMGCPEFQAAFDSASGSLAPFRLLTLTKGTGGKNYGDILASPVLAKELRIEFYRSEGDFDPIDDDLIADTFSVTDSDSKCFGFVVDSYFYVLMDDTNPMVATDESRCADDNTKRAICYYSDNTTQTVYLASRAVARLNTPRGSGESAFCTGWLLGNQGHIMTNYHCVSTDAEAAGTTVEFMVEDSACSEGVSCKLNECEGKMVSFTTEFIRSSEVLDYALLKLPTDGAQTAQTYGYLRLKTRDGVVGEQLYIPQHPVGGNKRISLEDDYASKLGLLRLNASNCGITGYAYNGDTKTGSSGSPVLSFSDHGVVALHHCGEMCANTGIPAKDIVADLKANGIDVAAFDGIDDGSSHTANSERFPAYTPPVQESTLPLVPRLTLDGAIILASGYVSVDKVEFTLSRDTDVSFAVVSAEIADNGTFIDLNGDCRASYLDSIIYLFLNDSSTPVFFADDGDLSGNVEDGSISYRDPYKRTFVKRGSYVLAVASMGSSQDDALAGKTRADYPPELYTCQARGSYGSYRLQISSTFGDNPFTFTRLPTAIGIDLTSCHKIHQWADAQATLIAVASAEVTTAQRWELADALVAALSRANAQSLTIVAALHLPYAKDDGLNVFYSGLNAEAAADDQVDVAKVAPADPTWEIKDPWLAALLHFVKVEQWPRTHLLLAKGYKPGRDLAGTYEAVDALAKALQVFTKEQVTVDSQEVQRELPRLLAKEKIASSTAGDDHLTLLYH